MLDALTGTLEGGRPVVSVTVGGMVPESEVADLLRETERAHEGVSIGSYPFFRDGRVGANFVVRAGEREMRNAGPRAGRAAPSRAAPVGARSVARSEARELAHACADLLAASLESAGYPAVPGGIQN